MRKILIAVSLLSIPAMIMASGGGAGETIIHHLLNADSWKPLWFLPAIPLPSITIGGVTIAVTAHSLMMLFASIILATVFIAAFRNQALIPRGRRLMN